MDKKYYYKAMNKDMKCGDFQYKIGETYTIESEDLRVCSDSVFHFCKKLEDTIDYYRDFSDRHFLIEALGDIVTEGDESGSNKIRIVREISRDELEEHIQDKKDNNAKRFLAYYSSNIKTLEKLSKDKYWRIRLAVAKNPNTPVYILEKLSKDEDWHIRLAVKNNVNTTVHILEHLAKDKETVVRRNVAENPNTPAHILEILSKDEDWIIRVAIAENPNTPIYILENLFKDEYREVCGAVAYNPNTPVYILEELSKDKNKYIRNKAQARLKEITQ